MNYAKHASRTSPENRPVSLESGVVPRMDADDDGSSTDQTAVMVAKSVRSQTRPALMAMGGSSAGRVFRLDRPRATVGRSKSADVCLRDDGVSRLHCALESKDGASYVISDLQSTNGTLVNGGRVERTELRAGDRIQLGPDAVLQFGFYDDAEEGLANKLYEAATRDPLTQAYNRRYLGERLAAEVSYALRQREKLVAVLFDIDHFKSINDSYGHAVGDEVLRSIAAFVASTLRSEDVFARYGGEEFVVVARGLSLRNGGKLAERIRGQLERRVLPFAGHRFRATVSAGVAELGECKANPSGAELLELADARLYRAKQDGRNRVVAK